MNIDQLTRDRTNYCLEAEIRGARNKFPNNKFMLAALIEEVGELAKALMEHSRNPSEEGNNHVYTEAIQVAAMAIRLAEEGDPDFAYKYTYDCYEKFTSTK